MPISPNQGPTGGGTTVTITGVNLAGATAVRFGTRLATIEANTPTAVTVLSPAGTGVADVTVTTGGGTSNALPFYYVGPPFATSLSVGFGPVAGGNTVTINGFGLLTANSVQFGANSATPTVVSDSAISVVVPAGSSAGSVSVTVTTAGGSTSGLTYTYVNAPTISSLSPSSGPTSGGTDVTVVGTNLTTASGVTVGGAVASFAVVNSSTLVLITPPGTAGAADVVVTTTGGTATIVGGFTYQSGPGI